MSGQHMHTVHVRSTGDWVHHGQEGMRQLEMEDVHKDVIWMVKHALNHVGP